MSPQPVDRCVEILSRLIGFPTENPGGDELALCNYIAELLAPFRPEETTVVEVPRVGSRGAYVFARWGTPRLIINAHVDTVPANTGWTRDPFDALLAGDRLVGLGSADTKGSIAATLVALEELGRAPRDFGLLFSGDEELSTTCVPTFLASNHNQGIERALVCEPTARRMGVRHRGVLAYLATIVGKGGHSSKADHMPKPVVTMARLAVALDELGQAYLERGTDDMKGICMNIARLDGGVAFNVVPDSASLSWSVRPPPGFDRVTFESEVAAAIDGIDPAITFESSLAHSPFACADVDRFTALLGAGAEPAPLDFWTEAAVLSAAGIDAVVVGPGDIAQAHAADEYVTLADLEWAIDLFGAALRAEC